MFFLGLKLKRPDSFIHLFTKYLLSAYCMPGTIPGAGDNFFFFWKLHSSWGVSQSTCCFEGVRSEEEAGWRRRQGHEFRAAVLPGLSEPEELASEQRPG